MKQLKLKLKLIWKIITLKNLDGYFYGYGSPKYNLNPIKSKILELSSYVKDSEMINLRADYNLFWKTDKTSTYNKQIKRTAEEVYKLISEESNPFNTNIRRLNVIIKELKELDALVEKLDKELYGDRKPWDA